MKLFSRFCLLTAFASLAAQPALSQAALVDDQSLLDPDPAEWLTYGRDYAETHFSPLDAIDSENVDRLGLAWTWTLEGSQGRLESTPLVADGVMYATGTWSVIFALDARTGALKWKWDPAIVRGGRSAGSPSICCGPVNRGVALYQGKVYAGLLDGRLVALDAETGEVVWVRQTTPLGAEYSITGAPRIVDGKVIIGNGGAEFHGVRGYVTAYDAETGDQVWRFYTVPGNPADPFESEALEMAAETWAGDWWTAGGGGTVWDAFAYDPDANLLYMGTGNGSPWSREHRSNGIGDNLFLSSIIALNPDNGELVWYYQTTPGDDWDYTATQNIILADLVIDGEERQVLMQAPKNGFFYVLDRLTGALISAEPFTHTTWATHIDLETGRPVESPNARYTGDGAWVAPGPIGAHNWNPMSWNPNTGLVYLPGQNNMSFYRRDYEYVPEEGVFSTGTVRNRPITVDPPKPVTPSSFLVAWDPATQSERWRIPWDTNGRDGGTLSTGGNLVFTGTSDGMFYAYDAESGATLWEVQLARGPATPMTYELDGRQYVTVLSGMGGTSGSPARVYTFTLDGSASMP